MEISRTCSGFWPFPDPPISLGDARLMLNDPSSNLVVPFLPAPDAVACASCQLQLLAVRKSAYIGGILNKHLSINHRLDGVNMGLTFLSARVINVRC